VEDHSELDLDLKGSYMLLLDIFKLLPVKQLAILLLTAKIGFSACDAVGPLKMIEAGVPKEKLALMAVPLIPFQIFLPFLISKYIIGPRLMDMYMKAVPYRLVIGLLVSTLIFATPYMITKDDIPAYYYGILLIIYGAHQLAVYTMFVCAMAYYAKISDPRSGGTYMTLLNTVTNLGNSWPTTAALWFVDIFTWKNKECEGEVKCPAVVDGFYIEIILTTIFGVFWLRRATKRMRLLQNLDDEAWRVRTGLLSHNFQSIR